MAETSLKAKSAVKCLERGRAGAGGQQALGCEVAGRVGGKVALKLRDELWNDRDAGGVHCGANRAPAGAGVGGELLALDEGNTAMAEALEVFDGERGGAAMV